MYERIKPLMDKVVEELVPMSPDNEKTGERYSRFLSDFLSPVEPELTTFESSAKDLILVRDIELYSLCEHHLLPIMGSAFIAYFPQGKILGLSKIPRIVRYHSRRLQNQERLTVQIMDAM